MLQIAQPTLSNLEGLRKQPRARTLVGCEIVLGARTRDLFPSFYESVEAKLMRQASVLYERLEEKRDEASKAKCQLLLDMIERTTPSHSHV